MRSESDLSVDWLDFIDDLLRYEVKFIIVGAFALAYHRTPRATGDIDFFYDSSPENCKKLAAVIKEWSGGVLKYTAEHFQEPETFFFIGHEPNRIDLLNWISGVTFEEAWADRVYEELAGRSLPFLSLANLLKNKIASNRPKDQDDIIQLKRKLEREG